MGTAHHAGASSLLLPAHHGMENHEQPGWGGPQQHCRECRDLPEHREIRAQGQNYGQYDGKNGKVKATFKQNIDYSIAADSNFTKVCTEVPNYFESALFVLWLGSR